jgi:hypothetical protein
MMAKLLSFRRVDAVSTVCAIAPSQVVAVYQAAVGVGILTTPGVVYEVEGEVAAVIQRICDETEEV